MMMNMLMGWFSTATDVVVYGTWGWWSHAVNGAVEYGSSATSWFGW